MKKLILSEIIRKTGILIFSIAFLTVFITGCGAGSPNMPYEPDTPPPENHNGVYSSEHGTLTFNGDGETVIMDLDDELSGRLGLPSGEHQGSYIFLSGDLPPGGSVEVRYDVAHELKLTVDGVSVTVSVGLASEDGTSATVGTGMVTADRIPILVYEDGVNSNVTFIRE